MAIALRMVASEILACALKRIPFAAPANAVLESIKLHHEIVKQADRAAEIEAQMSRFEKAHRSAVASKLGVILQNLRRSDLDEGALSQEICNLRQIQGQGWHLNLFEGLFVNSSHFEELKRDPESYGTILDDRDLVHDAEAIHVVLRTDRNRILELFPHALSRLLARQPQGVPEARFQAAKGIWAFPWRLV